MTKQEFRIVRRRYRQEVKALWNRYNRAAVHSELAPSIVFVDTDESLARYDEYFAAVVEYAALLGCSVRQAVDTINLPTRWEV